MPAKKSRVLALPAFEGLGRHALAFLEDLGEHQTRDWFEANRAVFERELHAPLSSLVISLAQLLAERKIRVIGDPKTSVLRINRDIRFSKDKRPYKTNAGAVLSRDGTRASPGVIYVHIDPAGCFMALGFYEIDPPALTAMRRFIVEHAKEWHALEHKLAKAGLKLARDQMLTRLPRGFDEAEVGDVADVIRLKSFTVSRSIERSEIHSAALVETIADFAAAGLPLLEFGWRALDGVPITPRR